MSDVIAVLDEITICQSGIDPVIATDNGVARTAHDRLTRSLVYVPTTEPHITLVRPDRSWSLVLHALGRIMHKKLERQDR